MFRKKGKRSLVIGTIALMAPVLSLTRHALAVPVSARAVPDGGSAVEYLVAFGAVTVSLATFLARPSSQNTRSRNHTETVAHSPPGVSFFYLHKYSQVR